MCGSFSCSKNTLVGLNIVYVMVAFLLIGVATYGQTSSNLTSLPILGGIVASGVFLLFIAVLGLIATVKHHQVLLFFYMVILFGIFIIQFSVACACLAMNEEKQQHLAETAWNVSDSATKFDVESAFGCCGYHNKTEGFNCEKVPACQPLENCPTCDTIVMDKIGYAFNASGVLGLLFAFTEFVAIVVTYRFRKQLREMSEIA